MQFLDIVLSICGFLAVYLIRNMSESLKEMSEATKELNEKVAVIIERTETHGQEITYLREKQDNIISDVAHIKARIQ